MIPVLVVFGPDSRIKTGLSIHGIRTSHRTSRLQQLPEPRLNSGFDLVRPRIPGIIPIGNAEMTGDTVAFCARPSGEYIEPDRRAWTVRPIFEEPGEQCKTSVTIVMAVALGESVQSQVTTHAPVNLVTFLDPDLVPACGGRTGECIYDDAFGLPGPRSRRRGREHTITERALLTAQCIAFPCIECAFNAHTFRRNFVWNALSLFAARVHSI
jgi:hypothetical protein